MVPWLEGCPDTSLAERHSPCKCLLKAPLLYNIPDMLEDILTEHIEAELPQHVLEEVLAL